MVFFEFLIFFFSFFGIFYYLSGKNGMERQFLFFLFLGLFQPILASNEATMVSFNLLNFFAILFWIFSCASGRNGTERNETIIFIFSLWAFSNLFCLEMKPQWYCLKFWFFYSFFGIFYYLSGKNGTERRFLFFLFFGLFQPIFAWNDAITVSFNLMNIFAIFF